LEFLVKREREFLKNWDEIVFLFSFCSLLIALVLGLVHFLTSFHVYGSLKDLSENLSPCGVLLFFDLFLSIFRITSWELLEVRLDVGNILLTPVFFISRLFVCICDRSMTQVLSIVNFAVVLSFVTLHFLFVNVTLIVLEKVFSEVRCLVACNFSVTVVIVYVDFSIFEVELTLSDLTLSIFVR
jgi:hypothetical protein